MNKILIILKKEIRETFRDKKSLSMMLIIPLMIPLLVIGMSYLFTSETDKDIETYNKIGLNYEPTNEEISILQDLKIDYMVMLDKKDLENNFDKQNINLYITKENNKYVINYDEANMESSISSNLAISYLESYKQYLENNYLLNHGINKIEFDNLLTYEEQTVEQQNFYASYIINYAFLFILMAITVSATYPATDSTAGEKERGTLETILTFPIKSKDIIIGKLLSVTLSSLITGFISLILTIVSVIYATNNFDIYQNQTILNSSIILTCVVTIIAYSILISGLCISIASKSKTFKEAQSALTPLTFIAFFPGMIVFLLNIPNSILLSIIPFVNFSMIFTDVVNGNLNVLYLISMFISTIIFIAIVITFVIRQYSSEKVLF